MNTVPILKLELQRMSETLCIMLSEHTAMLDEQLQQAVKNFCTEGQLERVITDTANRVLHDAIAREVQNFYTYGPGREVVAEAVRQRLMKAHNLEDLQ